QPGGISAAAPGRLDAWSQVGAAECPAFRFRLFRLRTDKRWRGGASPILRECRFGPTDNIRTLEALSCATSPGAGARSRGASPVSSALNSVVLYRRCIDRRNTFGGIRRWSGEMA